MKKPLSLKLLSFLLLIFLNYPGQGQEGVPAAEWNQWRGPDRSGSWYNGPAVDSLSSEWIQQLWEVKIGPGYSGPTVSEGHVYVMDYANGSEQVHCFNAENGQKRWTYSYPVTYSVGYPTGPRASVQVFAGKAYSLGTMGHLYCFDAKSGEVVWHINTLEQYQIRIPIWGLASNPIMVNDKLILQVGGVSGAGIVAFHKDSGKEVWRSLEDEVSYSAPILVSQAGKQVVICWTGESISGLDPDNGQVYWSFPFEPGKMIMNIADPVYDPPYLFLSGFFDGSYLIKLDQENTAAELIYHRQGANERNTDALHCCISTPLIQDGYLYGIDSYGETRCLDLLTGDRIWEDMTLVQKGRWANVHLIPQGEKIWGFNELGELLLGKFTPTGYVDLGRVKVIDPVRISPNPRNGVCWSHPAFSGTRIFLRSDAKLVCIEIKKI
ncbi:MAG: PQQ-binding-like beta-propeller repeat protein [Bacteroidota bacterium]